MSEGLQTGGRAPVIINLGKRKRRQIRKLRRGDGPLLTKVTSALRDMQGAGLFEGEVQPVVFVVREKKKKRRGLI